MVCDRLSYIKLPISVSVLRWLQIEICFVIVSAMVEHVLEQSLVLLEIQGSGRDFILRVHGFNEYLRPGVPMSDFRHVHECIKLDQDVKLVLVQKSSLDRKKWSRTVIAENDNYLLVPLYQSSSTIYF